MAKRNKIIYWIATVWLALGMLSTGLVQLLHVKQGDAFTAHMGYPDYFLTLLGAWKIAGIVAILIPKFQRLKEWAYAGFFFAMSGALFSHLAAHTTNGVIPSLFLLVLVGMSWYFRPADRKLISLQS